MLLGPLLQTEASSPPKVKPAVVAVAGFYLLLFLATIYSYGGLGSSPLESIGFMASIVGRGAMAVIGMILVEQLYRNTPAKQRWG